MYEGYWEFLGGKLEVGESVEDVLVCELYEEFGIEVMVSYCWYMFEYDYLYVYVWFYFCKVMGWMGELYSKEG